jgi:hypothetical protein
VELETPFDQPDDTPLISPLVMDSMNKWHVGLQTVRIDWKQDGGDTKLNILTMKGAQPGDAPEDSIDELAQMIMNVCNTHYEEWGEPSKYKIQFRCESRTGKKTRKHCTISLPGPAGQGSRDLDEPTDIMRILLTERAEKNQIIEALLKYNVDLTDRMLEQSKSAHGQTEPLVRLLETSFGKYEEGLKLVAVALREKMSAQYTTKQLEIEGQNSQAMWRTIRPALKIAAAQFGEHGAEAVKALREMDEDDDDDEKDDDDDAKTDAKTEAKSEKKKTKKQKGTKTGSASPKEPPGDPNTLITRAVDGLLHTLTPDQWFQLTEAMNKKQYSALRKARDSKDDDAAAENIGELERQLYADVKSTKKMKGVLNDAQGEALEKLLLLAEKHTEEKEDAETA